jgi:hypothetical protein
MTYASMSMEELSAARIKIRKCYLSFFHCFCTERRITEASSEQPARLGEEAAIAVDQDDMVALPTIADAEFSREFDAGGGATDDDDLDFLSAIKRFPSRSTGGWTGLFAPVAHLQ